MRLVTSAAMLLSLTSLACAAAPPPAPPPPPPPLPSGRAPTLAIETRYTPDLTLTLRLDGVPVSADVSLTPLGPNGFEGSPGDLVGEPPGEEALALVRVEEGVYAAPTDGLARLTASPAFAVVVGGRRYPYPQPFGTHPAECAASLAAIRKQDPCVTRRPDASAPPAGCDDPGVSGFRLVVAELADRFDACWARADDAALARLGSISDASVRHAACARLAEAVGPTVATPLGMRLVPACADELPEPTRARLVLARRTADLPAAYELAKSGSSADMRAFYVDYGMTGDPRVEEIRALAETRFGPKRRDAFAATERALAAITKDDWRVRVCDLERDRVTLVAEHGRLGLVGTRSSSRACLVGKMMIRAPRRPPADLVARAAAIARARLGVREVEWVFGCGIDHWYFDPPAPIAPGAVGSGAAPGPRARRP